MEHQLLVQGPPPLLPALVQSPVISTTHVSPFSLQGHHRPCLALIPTTHWQSGGGQTDCPITPVMDVLSPRLGKAREAGCLPCPGNCHSHGEQPCHPFLHGKWRLREILGMAQFRGWVGVRSSSPVWLLSPLCVLTTHQWLPNINFSSRTIFPKLDFGLVLSHVKLTQQRGSAWNQGPLSLCLPTACQPPPQVTRGSLEQHEGHLVCGPELTAHREGLSASFRATPPLRHWAQRQRQVQMGRTKRNGML